MKYYIKKDLVVGALDQKCPINGTASQLKQQKWDSHFKGKRKVNGTTVTILHLNSHGY